MQQLELEPLRFGGVELDRCLAQPRGPGREGAGVTRVEAEIGKLGVERRHLGLQVLDLPGQLGQRALALVAEPRLRCALAVVEAPRA